MSISQVGVQASMFLKASLGYLNNKICASLFLYIMLTSIFKVFTISSFSLKKNRLLFSIGSQTQISGEFVILRDERQTDTPC